MMKILPTNKNLRIVFMGTPDFAVPSLKILLENHFNVVGVITAPDKPAGRGRQIQESPVKQFARENNLNILQPEKLKAPEFIEQLQALKPELQVVVAFRMLPKAVWALPTHGTFNLHASLLPQYRGAAPINWAVINGEKKTGVTTFFIEEEIDTGKVISQEEVPISDSQTAGELHDILMGIGSNLVLKTVNAVASGNLQPTEQSQMVINIKDLKPAPKIFKKNCKICWNKPLQQIYNHIRGLSPYPAAWTEIKSGNGNILCMKIFTTDKIEVSHNHAAGTLIYDSNISLKVAVKDGFINILSLQLAGKKRMGIEEFLRGFQNISDYQIQ